MIPRVHRRSASVAEVLHYLFSPGEYHDHNRPRVIAAWAYATVGGVDELQPATTASGRRVLRRLVDLLEQPIAAGVRPLRSNRHAEASERQNDQTTSQERESIRTIAHTRLAGQLSQPTRASRSRRDTAGLSGLSPSTHRSATADFGHSACCGLRQLPPTRQIGGDGWISPG